MKDWAWEDQDAATWALKYVVHVLSDKASKEQAEGFYEVADKLREIRQRVSRSRALIEDNPGETLLLKRRPPKEPEASRG